MIGWASFCSFGSCSCLSDLLFRDLAGHINQGLFWFVQLYAVDVFIMPPLSCCPNSNGLEMSQR